MTPLPKYSNMYTVLINWTCKIYTHEKTFDKYGAISTISTVKIKRYDNIFYPF